MNEILKYIVYVAFVVILALISHYVIPYIKTLTVNAQTEELLDVIARAVRYAEQKIVGEKKGKEKFNTVQMYLQNWMDSKGIKIEEKDLQVLIESAVYVMNNELQLTLEQTD